MHAKTLVEITALRKKVQESDLHEDTRRTVLWSLSQLPKQYEQFAETYDTRSGDAILRLVQGTLGCLGQKSPESIDAARVSKMVVARIHAIHVRLNLPQLKLKPVEGI